MKPQPGSSKVRRRYDRLAPFYDLVESPMEWLAMKEWRRHVVERTTGTKILEVGTGTGKNLPFYASGQEVTATDLSEKMLKRSVRRASPARVFRAVMDVESLAFRAGTFDSALATFLFCSVENPVQGLTELGRVVKSSGQILLLEHVRPGNPLLGRLFDLGNPLVRSTVGPNINRDTVENIRKSGLFIEEELNLVSDIVKLLVLRAY